MVKVANIKFLDGSNKEYYNFDTHGVEEGVAYFGRKDWAERLTVPLHSVKFISVIEE